MRLQLRQLAIFVLFSSCYSTPDDKTACGGSDVNIPWEYPDSAGMNTVSWEHIDASNVKTTILVQATGSAAMVIGGYNIQHNTNGDVTITAATVANSGTYRITVVYSSATSTFTDNVVVNVYDPPTGFSFTESPSGSQTTFTCTATSLGDTAAELYIQVNGVDQTSSVSATVSKTDTVKCFLSGSSVQCMSGVSDNVTSICVQCPKNPDHCQWFKPVCWPWWQIEVFIVIYILVLFLIGVSFGCFLIKKRYCCDFFYKEESCKHCVNNYYCKCKCYVKTPCGASCNIGGLPYWYQILWASIIGSPVAFGIWMVWRCCNNDKSGKYATSTRSIQKKAKSQKLNEKKQSRATGIPDGWTKDQHVSDTQTHPNDKFQKVHPENVEQPFRPQPLPPPGANINYSLNDDKQITGPGSAGSGLPDIQEADNGQSLTKKSDPLSPIGGTPRTDKTN